MTDSNLLICDSVFIVKFGGEQVRVTTHQIRKLFGLEISPLILNAARYEYLRTRDLDTIDKGGVFAGITPENLVLNLEDLDQAIDAAIIKEASNAD